jgi:hypothetical protein
VGLGVWDGRTGGAGSSEGARRAAAANGTCATEDERRGAGLSQTISNRGVATFRGFRGSRTGGVHVSAVSPCLYCTVSMKSRRNAVEPGARSGPPYECMV